MKNFLLTLALLCAVVTVHAADTDATIAIPNTAIVVGGFDGGSNKVAALSTNSYLLFPSCSEATQLDVHFNYRFLTSPGAGDSGNIQLQLQRGISATEFESNTWQTVVFAPGSTTTANATNFSLAVDGVPFLRGRFISVSTNAHATNITFKVRAKVPATKLR